MKKIALLATVVALVMFVSFNASAQKISLNIGAEVMLPMGSFGDQVGVGFGGTARGEYSFTPMISGTFTTGYITWGGKSVGGFDLGNFHGIPILIGGKYYFQPEGKTRFYGMFELGFMIFSVSTPAIPGVTVGGVTYGGVASGSVSETDFTIVPTVGVEIPAGAKGAIDISAKYFLITSTGTAGNIGARVGYKFFIN
jgi:hypothetical protein